MTQKCIFKKNCSGKIIKTVTNYSLKINNKEIVVPDVEILKCDTCGEEMFPYKSAEKIEAYKNYSGRFIIRANPLLHKKLIEKAKKDHRSLNQEVTHILTNQLELV